MKRISLLVISLSLLLIPAAVFAQQGTFNPGSTQGTYTGTTQTSGTGGSGAVTNPLGVSSFCGLIKALLSAIIAIGIPIAVLFIVFAGFKFVVAQGNPGALEKARQNLMYTLIGIGIFLGAWLLALVIANTVNAIGAGSVQGQVISCN